MNIEVVSPIKAYIQADPDELAILTKALSYVNTSNQQQLRRHLNNHWFKSKNPDGWEVVTNELKDSVHKQLIFKDGDKYFVRPGSLSYISGANHLNTDIKIKYPTPKKIPWANPLPFELHQYQSLSAERLVEVRHGNVQICTGAGKSAIILKVCRETGFRTAIVAPGKVVFEELLEKFEYHFGKGNVGTFGDGKKKLGKRFTICIGDSLANLKAGTPEWDFFHGLDAIAVDESHTWGAETLDNICHGVFEEVPYRFFFSATQTRGDGAEKLLQSIIGKTVYELTTANALKGGFICDHEYLIVGLDSSNSNYMNPDALNMKRIHFLRNSNIAAFTAKLINSDAVANKRQTLVLVEELGQIASLLPLLTVPYAIAHSEKNATRLAELGMDKVKTAESVQKFNKGEAMVLIGTSCIATGTNIYPTHNTINWVGGASEIKTKQGAVGRSVRHGHSNPWAKNCLPKVKARIIDFDVRGVYLMEKHLEDRIEFYEESETPIRRISLK